MRENRISRSMPLAVGALSVFAQGAMAQTVVTHYWNMDALSGGLAVDLANGASMSGVNAPAFGGAFGEAYPGAGNAMDVSAGYMKAQLSTLVQPGSDSFAISYWSYNPDDGNLRGPLSFDTMSGTTNGVQLNNTKSFGLPQEGAMNFRFDSSGGDSYLSNNHGSANLAWNNPAVFSGTYPVQPLNTWTHYVVNFDRTNEVIDIYVDGSWLGDIDMTGVSGTFNATQDMMVGSVNTQMEPGAFDDMAWYSGTLSVSQIADLAAGKINPGNIPAPGSLAIIALGGLVASRRRR